MLPDTISDGKKSCKNCNYSCDKAARYCPNCGQNLYLDLLKLRIFLSEIFKGFISWDAKFWHTMPLLLFKPGKLSQEYVNGRRNYYTNPFRMYFTVSILFFILLGYSVKFEYAPEDDSKAPLIDAKVQYSDENTSNKKKDVAPEKNDDAIKIKVLNLQVLDDIALVTSYMYKHKKFSQAEVFEGLSLENNSQNKYVHEKSLLLHKLVIEKDILVVNAFVKATLSYFSAFLFLVLPLFAWVIKLFHHGQKKKYMACLVFTFHVQTFCLILFFFAFLIREALLLIHYWKFLDLLLPWVSAAIFLMYLYLAFKRFFGERHYRTALKFIAINSCFSILGAVFFAVCWVVSFLSF